MLKARAARLQLPALGFRASPAAIAFADCARVVPLSFLLNHLKISACPPSAIFLPTKYSHLELKKPHTASEDSRNLHVSLCNIRPVYTKFFNQLDCSFLYTHSLITMLFSTYWMIHLSPMNFASFNGCCKFLLLLLHCFNPQQNLFRRRGDTHIIDI